MTVKELRQILMDLPDDMPLIHQGDPEGNYYSEMAGVAPDRAWLPPGGGARDWEPLDEENEPRPGEVQALFFWPV